MNKLVKGCIVAAMVFSAMSLASANLINSDVTFNSNGITGDGVLLSYGNGNVSKINNEDDWVEWAHNFTFDPAAASIESAVLTITLNDNDATYEEGSLSISDGTPIIIEAKGTLVSKKMKWDISGAYDFDVAIDVNDTYLRVKLMSTPPRTDINDNNMGQYDFDILSSKLAISYTPVQENTSVPEPTTISLLGLSLLGLGFIRKRAAK